VPIDVGAGARCACWRATKARAATSPRPPRSTWPRAPRRADRAGRTTPTRVSVSQAEVASRRRRVRPDRRHLGARRQRLETRSCHPGGHAELRLDGVYLLAGKRHADLTTVVTHEGVDGAPTS
jgi:hypothetical protein